MKYIRVCGEIYTIKWFDTTNQNHKYANFHLYKIDVNHHRPPPSSFTVYNMQYRVEYFEMYYVLYTNLHVVENVPHSKTKRNI